MLKNIHKAFIVLAGALTVTIASSFNTEKNLTVENEEAVYEPVVVLELFTSQGCSSCPSADLLLQKVKKEYAKEVFALSYHVDYWNYIGWKDPFSMAKFTEKQRQYNIKFRNRTNYTPQMVVNGKEHFVGSNSSKLYELINAYKDLKSTHGIRLKGIGADKKNVSFSYEVQGSLKGTLIRILLVLDERTTQVKRGENKNRSLQNSNIVVAEKAFLLEESMGSVKLAIPEMVSKADQLNLMVLVENSVYDITAAAKHRLAREL